MVLGTGLTPWEWLTLFMGHILASPWGQARLGGLRRAAQTATRLKTTNPSKCPWETKISDAHQRQRPTITLWLVLSFPFGEIYTVSTPFCFPFGLKF